LSCGRVVASWPPAWLTPVDAEAVARGDGEMAALFAESFGSVGMDGIAGRAGEPLRLRDWQRELLNRVYARDEDGGYVAQTVLIGTPRKNGKSALSSAALALYSLTLEGVIGAQVVIAAATRDQARIIFGEAKRMIEASELKNEMQIFRDSVFVPRTNSTMKVISSESFSAEGMNCSRVIIDELHAHKNRELFDVLRQSMGNRGKIAQLVCVTTAGIKTDSTGNDSVAFSLYNYGKRVVTGEVVDPSFFMAWWEAPEGCDHKDPAMWEIANPGFEDIVSRDDFASAVSMTPEYDFRRKRLNQWVTTKNAWLPAGIWASLEDEVILMPDDDYVLGFDGAWSSDSTGLVCVIAPRHEDDIYRVMKVAVWEKDFALDDDSWVVDKAEISNVVMEFVRNNPGCRELVADPYIWQDEMYQWSEAGIPVVEYPNSIQRTVPATAKLYEAILSGKLRHDGDAAMARHMENCILKADNKGGSRLTKDFRKPKNKIDLAICLLMAFDRASTKIEVTSVPQFYF